MNKNQFLVRVACMFILVFSFALGKTQAQTSISGKTVIGVWKTIDDETGKAKSHVQIFEKNGKVYGKIVKLLNRPVGDEDPNCDKCSGSRKNKKINGMTIITDMNKKSDKYGGGEILDPKNGKVYTCTLWMDKADVLKVRGWFGFIYRTQTWYRVK